MATCESDLPEGATGLRGVEPGHSVADGYKRGQQYNQHQKQKEKVGPGGLEGTSLAGYQVPHQAILQDERGCHGVLTRDGLTEGYLLDVEEDEGSGQDDKWQEW